MGEEKELELRMYGLVPYNISPEQVGIQYGHALQEYNNMVIDQLLTGANQTPMVTTFMKWANEYKTFMVLNGGTTNSDITSKWYGGMNRSLDELETAGITTAAFYEPDLGNQLSGFCFLADERVFKKKPYAWEDPETTLVYPDFEDWLEARVKLLSFNYDTAYEQWTEFIGGEKNVFLRKFLKGKRFA